MATYIKVGGTWRTVSGDTDSVCGYVKVDGSWRAVSNTWVKVDGSWRSVCAPTPAPTPTPTPTPTPGPGPSDPPQDSSVSSLSPSSGEAGGGYTVTINGSFPSNLTNIAVNGTNVGSFSRVSSTAYSFTMPGGSAGSTVQVQPFNGRVPLMSALTFTYNSVGGGETNTCVNGNFCGNIVYTDGTAVSVNAINGTFNGSLQTEPCGNGGTRTKAYTCVTPAYCPNISVGAGQCTGEVVSTSYYVSGCCSLNYLNESNSPAYGVSSVGFGEALSNASSACYYALTGVQYSNSTFPSVTCGGGTPVCNCSPLTSTSSTQAVPTSRCNSGSINVTIETYNQCCVNNGTVGSTTTTTQGACVPQSTECSGAACSEARCQTCAPSPLSYASTRSVSTSICASGTMNTFLCYTPGSCANIPSDTGCVPAQQNCTPVYSYREYRSSCGATVDIYVNPCTGAESFTCPSTPTPTPTPTPSTRRICSRADYVNQCCSCFSEGACDANGSLSSC
jgi:hypothetical protein